MFNNRSASGAPSAALVAAPWLGRARTTALRCLVVAAGALVALAALLAGRADAKLSAVGPVDPANNFPSYYQDQNNLRVEPCLDGPPICFATPADLKAPDGEAFYNNTGSTLTLPGNHKATLTLALEAAYAGPGPGQEITFGRVRFAANGGLTPGATYTVTHPYGTDTFVADANGAVPKNAGTQDIGGLGPCLGANPHAAGAACDFGEALNSRLGPFLQWDPKTAPAAPVGYLGDAVTPHTIIGSPTGTNVFKIVGPGVNLQTNLFTVEGKIAGPLMTTPSKLAFGSQQLGSASAAKTVQVKNISQSNVAISSVALDTTGNPGDFKVGAGTCAGANLAKDATCNLSVTFAPTTTVGTRTATVLISHNGIRSPEKIALTGSAAAVGTAPAGSLSPTALTFGSPTAPQRLGTQSAAQTVTITNGGTADLNVANMALTGADASDFQIGTQNCLGGPVAPNGGTCTVNVLFAPQLTAGTKTASLTITDDAGGSPRTVALTGTAGAGLTAVGGVDANTLFPTSYTDVNGTTLQLCLAGPPNCVASPTDLVAPAGEAFYNLATAKLATPNRGKAVFTTGLEAAYAGSTAGQQITFSRIRFTVSGGLKAGAVYKVTHPFGVDTYVADSSGAIAKKAGTQDVGGVGPCTTATAHNPGGVCDFALAMTSRFGPFLKWDPAVAPAAPAGYVGDNATDHKIIGSPLDTNYVRVEGPNVNPTPTVDQCPAVDGPLADCIQTDLFTVQGKLS
jgi:hypothetical protein